MHRAVQVHNDINTAATHDAGTVAYLLGKRRTAGGYNWNFADVKAAQGIVSRGIQLPFGAFLPSTVPLTERSAFNMASEDYVKRSILEEFGVLCQVKIVTKDAKGHLMWLMTGVCPFHRHVHDSQHWFIIDFNQHETHIGCFFPINETENDKRTHYPRAVIPHLPLVAPGDGADYPVTTRPPPLDG
jgi:hypothetical protein